MTAHEFRNALRIMFSLDEAPGLTDSETMSLLRDPFLFALKADDRQIALVFAAISERQPKKEQES